MIIQSKKKTVFVGMGGGLLKYGKKYLPAIIFVIVFITHLFYTLWLYSQAGQNNIPRGDGPTDLLSIYMQQKEYLLGLSYALAGAFTAYAFLSFIEKRRGSFVGLMGGVTLLGLLYFIACFLLGCCGSPMLAIYLGLLGPSFLGFTKPLILLSTAISVIIGYFWMKRCEDSQSCCAKIDARKKMDINTTVHPIQKIQSELQEGMSLPKCRKCGCMQETLENLQQSFSSVQAEGVSVLQGNLATWKKQMKEIRYACLGCEYCFPAVATNIFDQSFPEYTEKSSPACSFEVKKDTWPVVPGEYFAFCEGQNCPVAVSTLASVGLAESLAKNRIKELCIVGKTETENIGIDKVVKNTISNPSIKFLVVAGKDPKGHLSGNALLNLWRYGVDEEMKIINSQAQKPILRNVNKEEVEAFRHQVEMVDMIGCEDAETVVGKIKELAKDPHFSIPHEYFKSPQASQIPKIKAEGPAKIEMDKAGYFVIIPQHEKNKITVEHYSYDNKLQHMIEGEDARSLYSRIIENGWVSQLSHAAYLGKELTQAELSLKLGLKYIQDGA